eukprot:gene8363-188_t
MSYHLQYLSRRDQLIDYVKTSVRDNQSIQVAMEEVQKLFDEHYENGKETKEKEVKSKLVDLVPAMKKARFFTKLDILTALKEYDEKYFVSKRKYINMSFREVRHILNTAQVHSISPNIKLITLDADGTLYEDGDNIDETNPVKKVIINLLEANPNLNIAIITAAGYHHQATRYEQRFEHLLQDLSKCDESVRKRFFVMGGECNYCFCPNEKGKLDELKDDEWKLDEMKQWKEEEIEKFLKDVCDKITKVADDINLSYKYKLIKKPRAIGYIPNDPNSRGRAESCDEISLSIRRDLNPPFKFCSFHSNGQVWVDVGNKSLGVKAFQQKFGAKSDETLHIGDQWREVGNDIAARKSSCTLWIVKPKETKFFLELLLSDFKKIKK